MASRLFVGHAGRRSSLRSFSSGLEGFDPPSGLLRRSVLEHPFKSFPRRRGSVSCAEDQIKTEIVLTATTLIQLDNGMPQDWACRAWATVSSTAVTQIVVTARQSFRHASHYTSGVEAPLSFANAIALYPPAPAIALGLPAEQVQDLEADRPREEGGAPEGDDRTSLEKEWEAGLEVFVPFGLLLLAGLDELLLAG